MCTYVYIHSLTSVSKILRVYYSVHVRIRFTVNDKSSAVQKFHGLLDFIKMLTFAFCFCYYQLYYIKKCHNPKISKENFLVVLIKICENHESFVPRNFCHLR